MNGMTELLKAGRDTGRSDVEQCCVMHKKGRLLGGKNVQPYMTSKQ